jgi:hypothetical protein
MGKYDKLLKDYELHCRRIERSTTVDITETPQEQSARIKKNERNYKAWFEYNFPNYASVKCSWFHIKAADLIIRFPVIYLLLAWFRGAAKSVHVCMGIPLYLMIVKKDLKFMLLIGLNERKANRLLSDIQAQLIYNQRLINDYGKLFKYGDWSDGDFSTTTGVRFSSLGLGQDPRGLREGENRPDYVVIDDVDTKKRSRNPKLVREAVEYITNDIMGLFGKNRRRLIISNNLAFKTGVTAGMVKTFLILKEKSIQAGKEIRHHIIQVNRVDKKGNPEWPERDTLEEIEQEKSEYTNRAWESEMMNNPIEDGHVFKAENIQWKEMLPLDQYESLVIRGDLSYKDEGDFKALRFWGKIKREYHLIDCYVRQGSRRNAAVWLYDLFEDLDNKTNKLNIKVSIEGLFAQDEFVNDFDEEGDERGYWIDVIPDKQPVGNKFDRIESTSGKYERRRCWYNIEKKDSSDFQEGLDQLLAFEKGSGAPDDAPDADHAAFDLMDRQTFVEQFQPRITQRSTKQRYY